MSSRNSHRIRRLRHRQVKAADRMRGLVRTLNGKERRKAEDALTRLLADHARSRKMHVTTGANLMRPAGSGRLAFVARHGASPLDTAPPTPEKKEPKVHGVNAQRESRARPTVGGARGKKRAP